MSAHIGFRISETKKDEIKSAVDKDLKIKDLTHFMEIAIDRLLSELREEAVPA